MAVKQDIFVGYLEKRGIETGRLSALYNFTGSSGVLVFNNALPTGDNISGGLIRGDASPGISIGKSDLLETSTAAEVGYAYFDGTGTLLQVGTGIDFEDWTMFFSVKQLEEQAVKYGQQRVLATTSATPDAISGFGFGIAGNKAFFQYPDTDGLTAAHGDYGNELKTITNNEDLAERSIVSVSRQKSISGPTNKLVEISVHDIVDREVRTTSQYAVNDRHSDNWYLGNYVGTHGLPNHVGFSGYVDDFILVSGFLPENIRDELSKTFCATAYQREGASLQEVTFTKVTGYSQIDYNAVTGTGITGYEFNKVLDISTQDEDNTPSVVSLYASVGMTGEQTGEQRVYLTGEQTATTVEYVEQEEKTTFDPYLISGYSKDVIVPKDVLDGDDVLEVYSYLTDLTEKDISMVPKRIPREPNDIYFLDEGYTGENINVYNNGVLQTKAPVDLLKDTTPTMVYTTIAPSDNTGVYELGPEHGIREGQTYYIDFTNDYIPPTGEALTGYVGGKERGLGVLTGVSGVGGENLSSEWLMGEINMVAHKTRTVTAQRDGILIVHVPAGSERLIQGLQTTVKLDYVGNYELQNSGELNASGLFLATDDLLYDKTISGSSNYLIWNNQSDAGKIRGSGSDGKMYFYGNNLNQPYDESYDREGVIASQHDVGSDVYFNGQKMTSGINYTVGEITPASGIGMEFDMNTLNGATGLFEFAATVSGVLDYNRHTGVGASAVQAPFGLIREQVWVNGVRQERGEAKDYVKKSKFSRAASGTRLGKKTTTLYSSNSKTAGSSGFGTY